MTNPFLQSRAMRRAPHAASRTMANLLSPRLGVSRPMLLLLLGGLLGIGGCKDLTGSPGLPSGTPNPVVYNNATGALGMRNAAVFDFEQAIASYILESGRLTDELEDRQMGASAGTLLLSNGVVDAVDERILPEGSGVISQDSYSNLQQARGAAIQAIMALAAYDTAKVAIDSAKVLRGELYAFEGYAEIMLADLYCNGVPLSTIDFQKDFTYEPSSTTTQVYQAALAKFDTALTLAATSDSVVQLAKVGKGRAYLDWGCSTCYAAAADDVTTVPDGFQYQIDLQWVVGGADNANQLNSTSTISDKEGINGLPFLSSGDPRTTVDTLAKAGAIFGNLNVAVPITFPTKYAAALTGNSYAPFTLASGVEARLIAAEAALDAGEVQTWLSVLNQLRTNGTQSLGETQVDTSDVTGCDSDCTWAVGPGFQFVDSTLIIVGTNSPVYDYCINNGWFYTEPGQCDSLEVYTYQKLYSGASGWQAGTGEVAGLPPLTDPVADTARVSLMFKERAYWLFVTGHRQGDLRRLLRNYGPQYPAFQTQDQVYPTGPYLAPGTGLYGADVTVPIPSAESANPLFHGCLDRNP